MNWKVCKSNTVELKYFLPRVLLCLRQFVQFLPIRGRDKGKKNPAAAVDTPVRPQRNDRPWTARNAQEGRRESRGGERARERKDEALLKFPKRQARESLNPIVRRLFIYLGCSAAPYFRPSPPPPLLCLRPCFFFFPFFHEWSASLQNGWKLGRRNCVMHRAHGAPPSAPPASANQPRKLLSCFTRKIVNSLCHRASSFDTSSTRFVQIRVDTLARSSLSINTINYRQPCCNTVDRFLQNCVLREIVLYETGKQIIFQVRFY